MVGAEQLELFAALRDAPEIRSVFWEVKRG